MKLIEKLRADLKMAMINKDDRTKNLIRTVIGEASRKETIKGETDDAGYEAIIKKMVKDLKLTLRLTNNEEVKDELDILMSYLPEELSEDAIRDLVKTAMLDFPEKVENYKDGNKGMIGFFMGMVMKRGGGAADPKLTNKILLEELNI